MASAVIFWVEALGVVVTIEAVMAGLALLAAWRIERFAPPQGGSLDIDGVRLHVLDRVRGPPVV